MDVSLSFSQKVQLTYRNGLRYLPLLKNLVSRELKKKYRQSFLGYAWCVLNPLLIMLILTIVFSRMFHNKIENFPVYLCTGRLMFTFVTESANQMLTSIVNNGRLMRKTRIPYYVFPLASMGSAVVNFLFQLIALVIVLVFTSTLPTVHIVAFPLVCLEMFLFTFGLGMMLAVAEIYVRDTGYLFGVATTAWMYLSALFYPLSVLPEFLQDGIRLLNPAYYFMEMARDIFLYHQWPGGEMLLKGAIVAVLFTTGGLALYAKAKKQMILYV